MTTPYWVQDAIFYQIFPDRFANGDPSNDPPNLQKWGESPNFWGFQGGDLRGIIQRMDYLLDLGVDALYLNPIFLSPSSHRYNTNDYYQIDPKLGYMSDFRALLDVAHRNGMRVVLDGVFNHCGRGFFAFADVLENGSHSAYKDWFHIRRFPPDAYSHGDAEDFIGWWKHKSLPKFNTDNPQVRKYIYNVTRYWLEQGIDGWRLDVPNEIDDDPFWEEFRRIVKSTNRDAVIIGEIWEADPRWANDTHCDGLMNYPVRTGLLGVLRGELNMSALNEKLNHLFRIYPRENMYAMYVPLGSHDTERLATMLHNDLTKIKTAFLFQFAFPGAPAVYYGDEVGLEGGKDPDCRRAFPWDSAHWKGDLQPWVRSLIHLRKQNASLRRGEYLPLLAEDSSGAFAFMRRLGEEKIVAAFNFSGQEQIVNIPVKNVLANGVSLKNLLQHHTYQVHRNTLSVSLPPWNGVWLKTA
jgi:cyclomaltodextrinase / maltogenic alpha-amylase / neopullulanase